MIRKRISEPPAPRWKSPEPPTYQPTNPAYAILCAQAIHSWSCGADPQDVAEWLLSQQDRCPVPLGDMAFALRGLKPFRHDSALVTVTPVAACAPVNVTDEPDESLAQLDADLEGSDWEIRS